MGVELPLRGQSPASAERAKGPWRRYTIGFADPGYAPIRPTADSYEEGTSEGGHGGVPARTGRSC